MPTDKDQAAEAAEEPKSVIALHGLHKVIVTGELRTAFVGTSDAAASQIAILHTMILRERQAYAPLQVEVEGLRKIVAKLPKDAEGNIYSPPGALGGHAFYHPSHLSAAVKLFSQLFWWSQENCWGIACGGWQVRFAECYRTSEAAEAAKTQGAKS